MTTHKKESAGQYYSLADTLFLQYIVDMAAKPEYKGLPQVVFKDCMKGLAEEVAGQLPSKRCNYSYNFINGLNETYYEGFIDIPIDDSNEQSYTISVELMKNGFVFEADSKLFSIRLRESDVV
jgi:hypothetical protein